MRSAGSDKNEAAPRVVVTGMGTLTPLGHNVQDTWEGLISGRSGIRRLQNFDSSNGHCHIGGELVDFDPTKYLPRKQLRRMVFTSQLGLIATQEALADASLDLEAVDRDRVGVVIGTAGGLTIQETEEAVRTLISSKTGKVNPLIVTRVWPNMATFSIVEQYGLRGYTSTVCTACASATQAIGEAAEVLRNGLVDVMITGGTESLLSKLTYTGFDAMRLFPRSFNDDPARAFRPFDVDREGFVPAQGSGMLVLETLDRAEARGAKIYAEVLGYGISNDAYNMVAPDPSGSGAALAIQRALENSGVSTAEVDYINAHGTATKLGDVAETNAIKLAFGERADEIPISATKSMIGHMLGATGAIEAIACIKSIETGVIHPTINLESPDPECDLDYVPLKAREHSVNVALSNSMGIGGQNASLVLGSISRHG
jgi:3-oxoacyl-[acyl-carrier-protein] synthase II